MFDSNLICFKIKWKIIGIVNIYVFLSQDAYRTWHVLSLVKVCNVTEGTKPRKTSMLGSGRLKTSYMVDC